MQRLALFILIIILLIVAVIAFSRSIRSNSTMRFRVMGTDAVITVKDRGAPGHIKAARQSMGKISELLDRYNSKSDVSLLNRSAGITGVKVAEDTFSVIDQAIFVSRLTHGYFDITLKDYRKVKIDPFGKSVFLEEKGVKIDLGGIGKGYAVEKAREVLRRRGVTSAMIDMHSSIAVIGGPWKIGIKKPFSKDEIIETVILNNGEALSTSGSYEQGKHIFNPYVRRKVNTCQSVTVIAKDAGFADALSTALYAMGPQRAILFGNSLKGVKVIVITSSGKVLRSL